MLSVRVFQVNSHFLVKHKRFYANSFAYAIFRTFEFPSSCIESLLSATHSAFHIPWWVVIATTTLTIRAVVTLPLHIHLQKNQAKVEVAFAEVDAFRQPLEHRIIAKCRNEGLHIDIANKKLKQAFHELKGDILAKHHINMKYYRIKAYLSPFIQLPLFISISLAIRNLTGALPDWYKVTSIIPSMKEEGLGWFHDLTLADPYYLMPGIILVSNLLNISIYSKQVQKRSIALAIVHNFFRFMTIAMASASTQLPAGIALYWMLSSCYGLFQNVLFKYSRVRRIFGIPKSKSESENPIRDLLHTYKSEWTGFLQKQRDYHSQLK
ncbi:Mitochondrial inner membrane protein COX18-like [Oopsacas minuta]|uniref:Mitochondrial inner membrane protein COX18-like n=1 Tax=Oopsacas minuta TaxID=111878 RepID=A0AAV7JBX0_9METZ|nr:Mitochondrial inner membrane protein COX18-like [Oopsacas minuta]